jgi:hypothetical protein
MMGSLIVDSMVVLVPGLPAWRQCQLRRRGFATASGRLEVSPAAQAAMADPPSSPHGAVRRD